MVRALDLHESLIAEEPFGILKIILGKDLGKFQGFNEPGRSKYLELTYQMLP